MPGHNRYLYHSVKHFLAIALILLAFSCKKKDKNQNVEQHPVPSIPVQLTIYPSDPLYFKIQVIGGWMYVEGYGINGIIIYRKSEQEFVALERTSTHAPNNAAAKAIVMKDNFTLRDTVSNSSWQIFDGAVMQGPAAWPLRLYGTTYDGNVLKVRN